MNKLGKKHKEGFVMLDLITSYFSLVRSGTMINYYITAEISSIKDKKIMLSVKRKMRGLLYSKCFRHGD